MKEKIMNNTSKTDWDRIDATTDDEIDTSDISPLTDEFFAKAKLRMPTSKINTVAVSIDPETLAWFRSKGAESDRHMAAALKIYADAQKAVVTIL
jgi:uncharacterized protein (DUF4415 family)